MNPESWLVTWHAEAADRPTLLCLPHAGAGCGRYRPWQDKLGDAVSVVGVQLPGREHRWSQPHPSSMDEAAAQVVDEILALTSPEQPLVVFGESFGGLFGYELTRRLGLKDRAPSALVIAACEPPHLWATTEHLRRDDDALNRLLDAGQVGMEDLDEDSREFVLDILRRDARLVSTFVTPDEVAVPSPIHAWGGETDDIVTARHLDQWDRYTTAGFARRQFPGGHLFSTEQVPLTLPLLGGLLCSI
ncbi:thioesterase II family protein [Amycolatopsis sp. cg5]|uniref:thioesterase II family protein n=1 Tax=Amycolatopsis sp. cg5 TaxID=3238802 RepID=UPI003524920C